MARIYTAFGKENVVRIDNHMIRDGHLIIHSDDEEVKRIKHIIETGVSCNIKIDYEGDTYVDVYNEFNDCTLCKCGEITYSKAKSSVITKRSGRSI